MQSDLRVERTGALDLDRVCGVRSADEKPVGLTWPKPRRYRRSDPEDWGGGGGCPEVVDVGEDGPLRMRKLEYPE